MSLTRGIIDMPSSYLCMTCNKLLVHRYKCICENDYNQCENQGECSYYFCRNCKCEEKVDESQVKIENALRGKDLVTMGGLKPPPDEHRQWSDKEKSVLTEMLEKIATPGSVWESADDRLPHRLAATSQGQRATGGHIVDTVGDFLP